MNADMTGATPQGGAADQLDARDLVSTGRALQAPFVLDAYRDGAPVRVQVRSILRLLPAKRLVAEAEVDAQTFLVKVFIGRTSARYRNREVRGAAAIRRAGALTPRLEWEAQLAAGGGYVLAFEFMAQALELTEVWREAETDARRLALISGVMPSLTALHDSGVAQEDIHPGNFLFVGGRIYTIDGGGVRISKGGPLGEHRSLDNLALFLAQFHAEHDHLAPRLLEEYERLRGWAPDAARTRDLLQRIRRRRDWRKVKYIKKAFRDCSRFSCDKRPGRFLVYERRYDSPELRRLLDHPDEAMAQGELLKDGNTATVALVRTGQGRFVIKRYNMKGPWHRLSRACRKSRAWISWDNALRLEFLGLRAPAPVALIEERLGPLRGRAWFISEYVAGPDATVLKEREDLAPEMAAMARLLRLLARAGLVHGDLKASNFLLGADGPVLIDLDAMAEYRSRLRRARGRRKDLERFMKNWESHPRIAARFAELLR